MKTSTETLSLISGVKSVLIKEYGDIIHSVILFGSRANGSSNSASDYDIVVILNKEYNWEFEKKMSKTLYQFELENDILTDVHFISVNQLENTIKGKDPLFVNAIKNGIYL